jgi:hypothetical protein
MTGSKNDIRLYQKKKDVAIYLTSKKELRVEVCHHDERHQMTCVVLFSQPELIIQDIQCTMAVYPHPDCVQALPALQVMVGKRVRRGIMRQTVKAIQNRGCTHLINLFQEACYAVVQGQGLFRRATLESLCPHLKPDQINKVMFTLRPELIDSCVSYIPGSEYMNVLENIGFPREAECLKAFESACRSER